MGRRFAETQRRGRRNRERERERKGSGRLKGWVRTARHKRQIAGGHRADRRTDGQAIATLSDRRNRQTDTHTRIHTDIQTVNQTKHKRQRREAEKQNLLIRNSNFCRRRVFSARCNIYTSRAYATMSVSVCLSVCL